MEVFRAELLSKEWLSWQTQWRRVKADFEEEISFTCLERDDRLQVFQEVLQSLEKVRHCQPLSFVALSLPFTAFHCPFTVLPGPGRGAVEEA